MELFCQLIVHTILLFVSVQGVGLFYYLVSLFCGFRLLFSYGFFFRVFSFPLLQLFSLESVLFSALSFFFSLPPSLALHLFPPTFTVTSTVFFPSTIFHTLFSSLPLLVCILFHLISFPLINFVFPVSSAVTHSFCSNLFLFQLIILSD